MVTARTHRHNRKTLRLDPLKVRARLLVRGLTLADVARAHGVSRPLVSRILNGRRPARVGASAAVYQQLLSLSR